MLFFSGGNKLIRIARVKLINKEIKNKLFKLNVPFFIV